MKEIETYLKSLEIGGASKQTIRVYQKDLLGKGKFVEFFNLKTIEDLKALTMEDFIRFYSSQSNLNPTSFNGLVRSLLAFFNWLVDNARVIDRTHSFFSIRLGKKSRFKDEKLEKKVVLNEEESDALIKAGENSQDRFMIALMLFTALRRGSIAKIKLSDINREECSIKVSLKGGKFGKTFMDEILCTMLNVYLAERNTTSEYLFYATRGVKEEDENKALSGEAINNRVKAAAKKAGIEKAVHAHMLRGTKITNLIRAKGIHAAQASAFHASLNTTKRYDSTGDEVVRSALLG